MLDLQRVVLPLHQFLRLRQRVGLRPDLLQNQILHLHRFRHFQSLRLDPLHYRFLRLGLNLHRFQSLRPVRQIHLDLLLQNLNLRQSLVLHRFQRILLDLGLRHCHQSHPLHFPQRLKVKVLLANCFSIARIFRSTPRASKELSIGNGSSVKR